MRGLWPAVILLTAAQGWGKDFSSSAKGTTAARFLELGAGARAAAMGEAYTAVADDATALYWNPAGLTRMETRSATLMHAAYIDSSFYDYAAFGQNLGDYGAWGLGVHYFSAGKITETDETGTDVGKFTPNDMAVSLGYAFRARGFSLGIAGKFIRSTILDSAQTGAADVGLLSPGLQGGRLRLGAAASNLGGKIKFERESEPLPLTLKAGGAYRITDQWTAALDVVFPKSNDPFAAVGAEYRLPMGETWNLAGRMGFNSRTVGDIDGLTGVSFGVGLGLQRLSVDYGFMPLGSVGLIHRLSLSMKLSAPKSRSPSLLTDF